VRRVEPAFPDLLPVTHRFGGVPVGGAPALDPVEMRLSLPSERGDARDGALPRHPVRFVVHAEVARRERDHVGRLLEAGSGAVIFLDGELAPEDVPVPPGSGRALAVAPWLPPLWGGRPLPDLLAWRRRSIRAGVLLALGPMLDADATLVTAVAAAARCGAEFAVATPMAVPAELRRRVYDERAGEAGDPELENLFFHTDHARAAVIMERIAAGAAAAAGLAGSLPGPATAAVSEATLAAACSLLLWARRLDQLDGLASAGWQLRRAASALIASGREPEPLLREDNLRVIPGFTPWVEALARSLWSGVGSPFEELRARWMAA